MGTLDPTVVPADPIEPLSLIERAWQRCLTYGFAPGQTVEFEQIGRSMLDDLDERHADLLAFAHPHLQWISRGVAEASGVIMLTNDRGTVLRRYGRIDVAPKDLAVASRVGVSLAERCVGASAPSIALNDRIPNTVNGAQHFCSNLRNFFCVAAPIEGRTGELLGSIDITAYGRPFGFDALALVVDAVRAIENGMFEPSGGLLQAKFHVHPGLVDSTSACILLVDEDWTIRAANRSARLMLGGQTETLVGTAFFETFDMRHFALFGGSRVADLNQWRTQQGLRVFGRLRREGAPSPDTAPAQFVIEPDSVPVRATASSPTAASASVPVEDRALNLREARLRNIELALERTGGNVSAAAQLLGISRQTLYRLRRR
jgi:transcriptional regulator of acetoin/glycerol metabolism